MKLSEYWDELSKHDWYFEMSDSGEVYRKGSTNMDRLKFLAKGNPDRTRLLNRFIAAMYANMGFGGTDIKIPERPND